MGKWTLLLAVATFAASSGCQSSRGDDDDDDADGDADADADADADSDADADVDVPAAQLDCMGIFACAAECADVTCEDACYAEGTASAQAAVDVVVECWVQWSCEDGTCLYENCSPELQDCVAPSSAEPLPGDPPAGGDVPADLVGQWTDGNTSMSFGADGSVSRIRAMNFSGCDWNATETGVAVADGASMTLTITEADFLTCNGPIATEVPYQVRADYAISAQAVSDFYPLGLELYVVEDAVTYWLGKVQ